MIMFWLTFLLQILSQLSFRLNVFAKIARLLLAALNNNFGIINNLTTYLKES